MPSEIVSCRFKVEGVRTDRDVKKALQSLYDIFADHGLGQAAFDITGDAHADLITHGDCLYDCSVVSPSLQRLCSLRVHRRPAQAAPPCPGDPPAPPVPIFLALYLRSHGDSYLSLGLAEHLRRSLSAVSQQHI